MNLNVKDIFLQKLAEIQSRVPVKLNIPSEDSQEFQDILSNAIENTSNSGNTSANNANASSISASNTGNTFPLSARTSSVTDSKSSTMEEINQSIAAAAVKYDINPNLIKAVIKNESSFNPKALSSSGAQGLMQLMPGTAAALGVGNPWDIDQNIDGGTHYLKEQLTAFNGNVSLALAAYNAGPNSVRKYSGIPPYTETQNYVKNVLQSLEEYSA